MTADNGNALFLILIAVALFAALSYAVTQSGRGGGNTTKEVALITASQITQHAASIRTTITRMILTGTSANEITFDTGTDHSVFDPAGGGATDAAPPAGASGNCLAGFPGCPFGGPMGLTSLSWGYKGISDPTKGYYIADVGTNTVPTGRESFAFLSDIPLAVCEQINKGLGLPATPAVTSDVFLGNGLGLGNPAYAVGTNVIDGNPGVPFSCMINTSAPLSTVPFYVHALIEQ